MTFVQKISPFPKFLHLTKVVGKLFLSKVLGVLKSGGGNCRPTYFSLHGIQNIILQIILTF